MKVERHWERNEDQIGGGIMIRFRRRWFRFAAFYGSPPGSHIGFWRTRYYELQGVNLRIGKRYVGPCLTVLAHTRSTDA